MKNLNENYHSFGRDTDFIPIYGPKALYTSRAEKSGKSAYAVVELIVTETGSVRNIIVVEELPKGYGFGKSAFNAAEGLKCKPRKINGVAVEIPGVLYKFSFAGFAY